MAVIRLPNAVSRSIEGLFSRKENAIGTAATDIGKNR